MVYELWNFQKMALEIFKIEYRVQNIAKYTGSFRVDWVFDAENGRNDLLRRDSIRANSLDSGLECA